GRQTEPERGPTPVDRLAGEGGLRALGDDAQELRDVGIQHASLLVWCRGRYASHPVVLGRRRPSTYAAYASGAGEPLRPRAARVSTTAQVVNIDTFVQTLAAQDGQSDLFAPLTLSRGGAG